MISTILIPVTGLVILSLLLWSIIGARGNGWLKIFLITMVIPLAFIWWSLTFSLLGIAKPTELEELPEHYKIYWMEIQEPHSIYLMASSTESVKGTTFGIPDDPALPHLYKLPYTRESHEQAQKIQALIKQGKKIIITRDIGGMGAPPESAGGGQGPEGNGRIGGHRGANSSRGEPFGYILPPATPREKYE